MVKLSPATCQIILQVFAPEHQAEAAHILAYDCADNLPLFETQDEIRLDRMRFAVLKLCRGSLSELRWWVSLAQEDWRSVLLAAGFAEKGSAHQEWAKATYGVTSTEPSET
jgi:hypothetical protein